MANESGAVTARSAFAVLLAPLLVPELCGRCQARGGFAHCQKDEVFAYDPEQVESCSNAAADVSAAAKNGRRKL